MMSTSKDSEVLTFTTPSEQLEVDKNIDIDYLYY